MVSTDESMDLIKLLAGAAQEGARGDIALAALEVMEALEAVQSSKLYVQHPEMFESAFNGLIESCQIRITDMMSHDYLKEQVAYDLALGNGRVYEC